MNKIELEKMFDKEYTENMDLILNGSFKGHKAILKKYIFETIIPEVLKSIIPKIQIDPCDEERYMNNKIIEMEEKAKELYGITL